jgi:acetyl esterase/lipase
MNLTIPFLIFLSFASAVLPAAGQNNVPPEVREMARRVMMPIVYKDPSEIPPLFIGGAGRDEVPTMDDSIDRFVTKALARNIAFTLANHPQGVHSFDNQNDDERSRETIRGALMFMQLHLNAADRQISKPLTSTMTGLNDFDSLSESGAFIIAD